MENNKKSEREEREARVNKEYKKWAERYEIPLDREFDVKALLQLQDEYNCFQYQPDKTKTRIDLMCMIERLERNLNLQHRTTGNMYVDYDRENQRVTVYYNDMITGYKISNEDKINGNGYVTEMSMYSCSKKIRDIANYYKKVVYIDNKGCGMVLFDLLCKYEDITVKPLVFKG